MEIGTDHTANMVSASIKTFKRFWLCARVRVTATALVVCMITTVSCAIVVTRTMSSKIISSRLSAVELLQTVQSDSKSNILQGIPVSNLKPSEIGWSHATQSLRQLAHVLADDSISMIEVDLQHDPRLGVYMSHNKFPNRAGADLQDALKTNEVMQLEDWLDKVMNFNHAEPNFVKKKGIKFDFKSAAAATNAMKVLAENAKVSSKTLPQIWLNADVARNLRTPKNQGDLQPDSENVNHSSALPVGDPLAFLRAAALLAEKLHGNADAGNGRINVVLSAGLWVSTSGGFRPPYNMIPQTVEDAKAVAAGWEVVEQLDESTVEAVAETLTKGCGNLCSSFDHICFAAEASFVWGNREKFVTELLGRVPKAAMSIWTSANDPRGLKREQVGMLRQYFGESWIDVKVADE